MMNRFGWAASAVAVLAITTFVSNAGATVIGGTLNADLTNGPFTINLGDNNQASYTFSSNDNSDSTNPLSLMTGGSALAGLSDMSGLPVGYRTGAVSPFVDDNIGYMSFGAVDSPTPIYMSSMPSHVLFKFQLEDGFHFGYAETNFDQLLSYGYQSDPGVGIQAGVISARGATAVPEPASWAFFALGLGLIGGCVFARRRANRAVPDFTPDAV